ncbi:hypothetical protein JAAARDRAFT_195076 [Jaapia argillacea MUCL 33604]|uniref:Uncharacterized protein n=1 Tax=Jaapia argillacea MUCL 33604 TaxID=933084 RepID=A0A067PYX0_9AGAM|nr:hypothetical protein JAAARDRAFT_195076 [Jaapia argillacea MUCL 33604]
MEGMQRIPRTSPPTPPLIVVSPDVELIDDPKTSQSEVHDLLRLDIRFRPGALGAQPMNGPNTPLPPDVVDSRTALYVDGVETAS